MNILNLENLIIDFKTKQGWLRAVHGISLKINQGEIVGIVGESGCGKTVTALSLLGLLDKNSTRVESTRFTFLEKNFKNLSEKEWRTFRGNEISMIFQEPMTALNPVLKIETQICDVICQHRALNRKEAAVEALKMLEIVKVSDPKRRLRQYPHELSGGMRQRVLIGMALVCRPSLLIADEPTTALDVTTQAQILKQIKTLQQTFQTGVLMITHDLGVVSETCERVIVMYAGRIVEEGPVASVLNSPRHPYTLGLLNSVPTITGPRLKSLKTIEGQVPPLGSQIPGCTFADRCQFAQARCHKEEPVIRQDEERRYACFYPLKREEERGAFARG